MSKLKPITYISVDTETTGLIPNEHRILQVALVAGIQDCTSQDLLISEEDWNNAQPEALKVNGWTKARMMLHGGDPKLVDDLLVAWLDAHEDTGEIRAVGWNVGSFDLQLMRYDLPRTFSLFSHRSVDLNSVCSMSSNPEWKAKSKEWARKVLGRVQEHDALWDAQEALLSFYYLKERFQLV